MTRLTDEFDFDAWVTRQIRDCERAMDSEPGRVWVDAVLLWNVLKGMQHWRARADELEAARREAYEECVGLQQRVDVLEAENARLRISAEWASENVTVTMLVEEDEDDGK